MSQVSATCRRIQLPEDASTSEYALPARSMIASRILTSSEERCKSSGAITPSDNVAVLEERDLAGGDARVGLKWRICEPELLNSSLGRETT